MERLEKEKNQLVSKKLLQWIAALSVLALLAGACSNKGTTTKSDDQGGSTPEDGQLFPQDIVNKPVHEGTPQRGGTLTFGVESDVLDVSPNQKPIQPADVQMAYAVFDPLLTYGTSGKFEGTPVTDNTDHKYNQLADKLEHSQDLKTWTLTLRDGVKFSNGKPVNADAVVAQTEWVKNSSNCSCKADADSIESVTKTGPLTVQYVLKEPVVSFPTKLVGGGLGWLTEPSARGDQDNPGIDSLIGAGPFEYQSHSGNKYTVVKNPNYYGKDPETGDQLPYLDKIVFQPLNDSTTRLQAVQSNGVQVMQTADTANLVQAKNDSQLQVQPSEGSSSTILVLNLTHPPFGVEKSSPDENDADTAKRALDDPTALEARQAFNYSINRNEINQKYYKGTRVPAYGFIPKTNFYYDPDGQLPRYDPVKAKKLIADLKSKGMSTTINALCINTPESTGIFAILKEQGKKVGINAKLRQVEQAILVNTLLQGQSDTPWDVACFRSPQLADPDGIYNALITGGTTNLVKYSREVVDKDLNAARKTANKDERKKFYDEIQEQVADDVVYIPLLFDYYGNVFRDDVSGLSTPSVASLGIIRPGDLYYKK